MKKFLTIALALVMVFAIAAPAFAIGGSAFAADPSSAFDDQYDVSVAFYQGQLTATNIGTAVPKADLAAKNQEITTAVIITRKAAYVAIANYNMDLSFVGINAAPTPTSAAFKFTAASGEWADATAAVTPVAPADADKDGVFESSKDIDALLNTQLPAVGDKLAVTVYATAAADIKADVTFGGNGLVPAANVASTNGKYDVKANTVAATKNVGANIFTVANKDDSLAVVFETKTNGMLDTIKVGSGAAGAATAAATNAVTQGQYIDATTGKYTIGWIDVAGANTVTADEAAFIDAVFKDFNLDYAKKNDTALAHSDFLPYLNVPNTEKTATLKLFTAALTVADTTTVPNTGDNAAVIGFVMIALAIVAAAAVAVKKVRA